MTNYMISFILSFGTITLMTMCAGWSNNNAESTNSSRDYKSYYYPIDDLKNTKIYHYVSDDAGTAHLYWVLTSFEEKGKVFFATDSYTMDSLGILKQVEIIKEELNDIGSYVKEYTEFQYNDKGNRFEAPAVLDNECVFKWYMNDNDVITWSFETENKLYPSYITRVQRNREYNDETAKVQFNGKDYDAIVFADSFKIEYISSALGDKQEINFTQTSYYAKGIGLYQFVRNLQELPMTYTLDEILSLDEWNELKNGQ